MTPRQVVTSYLTEVLQGAGSGGAENLVSNDELLRRSRALRSAFPDLQVEALVVLAEGDLVAVHSLGRGTHLGLFQGAPPTARTWEAHATGVYRVREERIVEAWVTWDNLSLMEQIRAVERVATVSA
jgi:predicted ester cyclase